MRDRPALAVRTDVMCEKGTDRIGCTEQFIKYMYRFILHMQKNYESIRIDYNRTKQIITGDAQV